MSAGIEKLRHEVEEHLAVAAAFRDQLLPKVEQAARAICAALAAGGKVMTCGNGGSSADSLHLAEELTGRYRRDRRPLAGMSLVADATALTCIGNDYGFENIFGRQVEAHARRGDVVVGITTSGNSENVIRAIQAARTAGAVTIGLLGREGGQLKSMVDHALVVPSQTIARIQEMHVLIIHMLCERVEDWVLGTEP